MSAKEPAAPREIMRAKNISSPSVIRRHLDKLTKWGWISVDPYGRYEPKKKVCFYGYFWLGKKLLPTSVLSLACLILLTVASVAGLVSHLSTGVPLNLLHIALISGTVVTGGLLLAETLRPRKKRPKEDVDLS